MPPILDAGIRAAGAASYPVRVLFYELVRAV
jgi:hypothetical protein